MMTSELLSACGLLVGIGVLAVANGMGAANTEDFADAGMAGVTVAAGVPERIHPAAVELEVFACDADHPPVEVAKLPLAAASLGELQQHDRLPVRSSPGHVFAATSWKLPAGCYVVRSQPVDRAGRPLEACAPARSPETRLLDGRDQPFVLMSDCPTTGREGLEVAGRTNHAPDLVDLSVAPVTDPARCDARLVCATARDPDGDSMVIDWAATGSTGRLQPLVASSQHQREATRIECVPTSTANGPVRVRATVRDQYNGLGVHPLTYEDRYLGRWAMVAHSRDTESVRVAPDCPAARCPDDPRARITDVSYWITRDGRLMAPTDELSAARSGDMVDVEFQVAPGCTDVPVTFASYAGPKRARPSSVFTRTYDAGTHLLWNDLPDCSFVADFSLGPPPGPDSRAHQPHPYGDRLIDSFAGGRGSCR